MVDRSFYYWKPSFSPGPLEQKAIKDLHIQNTSIDGFQFMQADFLRDEQITYDDLIKATGTLNIKLITQHLSVVLYHLDSITLSKFSIHEIETIFDHIH